MQSTELGASAGGAIVTDLDKFKRLEELRKLEDWQNIAKLIIPQLANLAGCFIYHDTAAGVFVYYDHDKQVRAHSLTPVLLHLMGELEIE